jgi:hypothetical protein
MAGLPPPAPGLAALVRPPGSRFAGLCLGTMGHFGLTSPPRAFRVSGALPATMMLIAAFRSRSMTRPQASQRYVRTERGSLAFTAPHPEHVLLLGYQRSMTCKVVPVRTHLYSSSRRNSPNEASSTAWARLWLATIPATLRSSIEISE